NRIRRDLEVRRDGDSLPAGAPGSGGAEGPDLLDARYLFEAADYVGRLSVAVQQAYAASLQQAGASGEASFILGGQIAGQPHGLCLIYPQGNAVMATQDTPFLQIGESKYGKPPLDYIGHTDLSLEDAARLCLVSQIITRRSNLTVGPPFEIAMVPANEQRVSRRLKLTKGMPEINRTMEVWSRAMREAIDRLPRFPWEEDPL
ncbi:MAG: 20S proteasome subunit A/B, partial [Cyanobacteriota bacterium]